MCGGRGRAWRPGEASRFARYITREAALESGEEGWSSNIGADRTEITAFWRTLEQVEQLNRAKPLYTDYANDGGVNVLLRKNGNIIASTGWSGNLLGTYGSLAFGSAMTTVFDAPAADTYTGNVTVEVVAFRGSTDTGIVNQGDYYTRTLSGSYTNFSFSNLRLKWTFI